MKIKLLICAAFILFLTSCQSNLVETKKVAAEKAATGQTKGNVQKKENAKRKGKDIVFKGKTLSLKAINFDNLTWYSDEESGNDTKIYRLHHTEKDYDEIKKMGFNSVRFFIKWQYLFKDKNSLELNKDGWKWLDENIEWAKKRGIQIILDFHCPDGGFGTPGEGAWPIWSDKKLQKRFVSMWKTIDQHYKNEPTVIAYDIMNEPSLPRPGKKSPTSVYASLMNQVISAIREQGSEKLVIVEAAVGIDGDPNSWTRPTWVKVSDTNVMYSFHFYDPLQFTHYDADKSGENMKYLSGNFTKVSVKKVFMEFIATPATWGYPLFLGEFGCNDWSPKSGSDLWIKDVYSLCKKSNIHTAFFCYRSFSKDINTDYDFAISRIQYGEKSAEKVNETLYKLFNMNVKD